MGEIRKHPPVKLIVGMIGVDESIFSVAEESLSAKFGVIDFQSNILHFVYTDYYIREMGSNLFRKFITLEKLIQPEEIATIKLFTNELEKEFLFPDTSRRKINLDPGYVTAAKLILASTKDHIHRIYLKDGIFVETTLRVENKSFQPWQWTYPDYRSEEYIQIFNEIRQLYMSQLRDYRVSTHSIPIVR
jgi:hypothetical protein